MQPWIAATIAGICLGLAFYGCVRLRMYLGPLIRDRFGNVARRVYWLLTIAVMVILANVALFALRQFFAPPGSQLMPEIWFIMLAAGIAYTLISNKVTGKKP